MSQSTRVLEAGRRDTHTLADVAYDAIYIAGIGGGAIVLFFLVFDLVARGQVLFTPSLLGRVLFDGVAPQAVQTVDMLAVAKYSIVHFVAFGLIGLGLSALIHQAEIRSRHPLLAIALVFAVLELGFWLAASLAIPGVLERIGHLPVAAANLLAAAGVTLFFVATHRPDVWARLKRALRLA